MTVNDYDYFRRRAEEEEKAACLTSCLEARMCHRTLADAYRRLCADILKPLAGLTRPPSAKNDRLERQDFIA